MTRTSAAILAIVSSLSACQQQAQADTYKKGAYTFTVASASRDQVREAVIEATHFLGSELVPPDAKPVLPRWRLMPCYKILGAGAREKKDLQKLIQTLDQRSGFRMTACDSTDTPSLTYFFTANPTEPAARREIIDLLGSTGQVSNTLARFLSGVSVCYWHFTSGKTAAIERAVVLTNSRMAAEADRQQCVFAGTLASSGIGKPIGIAGQGVAANSDEWRIAKELNLLAFFIV